MSEFIRLENITKSFGGVHALTGVNLSIRHGEVLALVGENGAGKSTLMKVLSGVFAHGHYGGKVFIDGKEAKFTSPLEAEAAGIAIIHQELSIFRHLSVAENLSVGHWKSRAGFIDWKKLNEEAGKWLRKVGLDIPPNTPMASLSVGAGQLVEIAKALSRESQLIILDEPTSALTNKEVDTLFGLIRELRGQGKALVYISHKLEEIYEICDQITVLRDGKSVHSDATKNLGRDSLISHMVGRSIEMLYPTPPKRKFGSKILEVRRFEGSGFDGKHYFGPLDFDLRRGEILGFAGLLGSGRSELMRALMGDATIRAKGGFVYRGKQRHFHHPREAARSNMTYVSEDRKLESIFAVRPLSENASVTRLMQDKLSKVLFESKETEIAKHSLDDLRTKYSSLDQPIQSLSGGNQQKVILARALQAAPEVILLDEPTRGVDVGAKFEIYEILFRLAAEGKSLLVVSSELPELMALADRVIVLSHGKQMGELKREDYSQKKIMELAVG